MKLFGIKFLRKLQESKKEEQSLTERWRYLLNEELHRFCISLNIIRLIRARGVIWTGNMAGMKEVRNSYHIFVGKPEW
jgi:hypothetical protein